MLCQETPRDVIFPEPHPQMGSSSVLCYVFMGKFLPSPIFHRLLAACVAHWPIATKKKEETLDNLIFCGCCVLQLDHFHKLIIYFRDYTIFMRVTRKGITEKTPSLQLCIKVREFVTAMLVKIIGCLGQSLKFEHYIQCPEYTGDSINSLIPVSLLKENEDVCCELHDNIIMSKKLLEYWFEDMQIFKPPAKSPRIIKKRNLPPGKKWHIFFSYCSSDVQWVRETVERLENDYGFVCCEYDRDNTPGTPLFKFADDSIRHAYKTVVVMTRDAFQSGFVLHEIDMAITQGFYENRKCVVPVLLKDCEVPLHLKILNYVDARDTNMSETWWRKLLLELETQENMDIEKQTITKAHNVRPRTMNISSRLYQSKGVPCLDSKLLCHILKKSQQNTSSRQSSLEENCLSMGLEFHGETSANGNCFFEAVSSQLQRLNCVVQKSPQQLRQEVVNFMRTNRVLDASEGTINLDSFIHDETFDKYCTRMARDGEWADHVVVVAMARKLQMDIFIVTSSPSSGPDDIIVWIVGQTGFQGMPIILGHIWESHYLSLQPSASEVIQPDLVGHSSPAPISGVIQAPASGSKSSTAVGLIQATTTNASSISTIDVMQIPASESKTANTMKTPASESTTVDTMQIPASESTTADVISVSTIASAQSSINCVVQASTAGFAPSLTSTTAEVMQPATSNSTTADDMDASASGSTIRNIMPATTSALMRSTTNNVMPATMSPSIPSTSSSSPCPISYPTIVVMQTPTSLSTITADILQAQAAGSIQSTTTGSTPCPTSTSTPTNVIQAPTSALTTTCVVQGPSSRSTTNVMQTPTSSSTTGLVMQPPSVDDTDRFMHIACLLVNVGSRILRRLLIRHTVTATSTLDQYLAKYRIAIDNLRKRKILNNSQMDILFPHGGSSNICEYDISLLSVLLTSIVPTISQQQLNMIQFLRDKRNEIFAHATSVTVNSSDYQVLWNDICRRLEALSKQCGDPDFENEIAREIQRIKVSTIQGTSFLDTLQTYPRRMETLERLVQDLILSRAQESNK